MTQTATAARPPEPAISPRRVTIYFQDDAVRQQALANVQRLLATASLPDATGTTAVLAKKALKYRKVLDRLAGVDVTSPTFNASAFLSIDWCKTPNLKAHCARAK